MTKNCRLGRDDDGYSACIRAHHCEQTTVEAKVRMYGGDEG